MASLWVNTPSMPVACHEHASSMLVACAMHASSNALGQCPSPFPSFPLPASNRYCALRGFK